MRPLLVFLLGVVLVFGAIAAAIVLTRPTERAFVVVDDSFPMRAVWDQVPRVLDEIEDEGYAEVALATEKDLIAAEVHRKLATGKGSLFVTYGKTL